MGVKIVKNTTFEWRSAEGQI